MHTRTRILSRPILVLVLLFGMPLTSVAADDSTDRQAIESAARQWTRAFNARDTATLAALTTEDVLVLDGSANRIDNPALASHAWVVASALTQGEIKTGEREIVITGDTAWRVGAVAYKRSDGAWHKGQTLEIWKRTRDGWKLHRQMSSHLMEHTLRPAPSEPVLGAPTN